MDRVLLLCTRHTMLFTRRGIQSGSVLYNMAIISQFKQGCHTVLDQTVQYLSLMVVVVDPDCWVTRVWLI